MSTDKYDKEGNELPSAGYSGFNQPAPDSNDAWCEGKIKQFNHYINETDWQAFEGGELFDVEPIEWLRKTLKEAIENGLHSQRDYTLAKRDGRQAERERINAVFIKLYQDSHLTSEDDALFPLSEIRAIISQGDV